MQSGRGEEAADGAYRPMPIPREPQAPAVPEAREGVVLPAHGEQHGEQWAQPDQVVQPASGQPWGAPQQPQGHQDPQGFQQPQYGPPQAADADSTQLLTPYGQQSEATQLLTPYGQQSEATQLLTPYGQQSEATQLLAPYGQQSASQQSEAGHPAPGADSSMSGADSERTQLIAPLGQPSPELPQQSAELRQPLPPEQQFQASVPPLPQQPPAAPQPVPAAQQPPMPSAAPYAIRPGTPGDQPPEELTQQLMPPQQSEQPVAGAAPTQQLPRFNDGWQSPQQQAPAAQHAEQAPPQAQDDYDFLYRKDGGPGTLPPQQTAAYGMPPQPPHTPPPPRDPGHGGRAPAGRKKLSPAAMIGIGVAGLAVIGVAVGAALSGGSNSGDQQKAGVASPAAGGSTTGGAGGDATQAQAKQLDALLKDSNSSRSSVISAVDSIRSCTNLDKSASDLRTAASQRGDLVTRLDQLTLDKLPNHDELVKQLSAAWKASAEADNDYATWADQVSKDKKGCEKGHAMGTPAAQKGNAASGRATFAKKKAADLWNPIAGQYGLTQRQFTDL
ncbi:hypothetical protein [Streptantibioticus ferralitis]|uniref:Uncharacterized protein n=1 Tax=Streptantibioticus ferralitis TaxID=236510 RepID=A0ABT5ZD19_9ACTN|nr:hypothetical protein [Streptantibioticus ferralitis]MDF2261583.1 hypothetical protein [Streptantibioticus ferralitis]